MGFIFGGDTGQSYEALKRRQAMAEMLMQRANAGAPRNFGEGLTSMGQAIGGVLANRRATRGLEKGRKEAAARLAAILSGGVDPGKTASSASSVTPQNAVYRPKEGETFEMGDGVWRGLPEGANAADFEQKGPYEGLPQGTDPSQMVKPLDKAAQVYVALQERGLPPHVAAGLVGNIMQESGPGIDTGAVGDGGNAFGMAQWNGPRRKAYMQFAQERGADPTDMGAQIEFLMHELNGPEAAARDAIMSAQTPEEAALIASQKFWRPGIPHNEKRQAYAAQVAQQMAGGQPAMTQMAGAGNPQQMQQQQAMPSQQQMAPQAQNGISPRLGELLTLASDPYLSDSQRRVAEILIAREMQTPETMTPYQRAQLDLQNRRLEAQLAGKLQTGTTVNVGPQGQQFPDAPKNFLWKRAPDGTVLIGENGLPTAVPIPGGPADVDATAQAEKEAMRAQSKAEKADLVSEDINRALAIVETDPAWSTGIVGQALRGIGGTQAHNLDKMLDSIKSNIGFAELNQMRAESPTGGALGNVTERELQFLQSVMGSLETSQTAEQLAFNLRRLDRAINDVVHGPQGTNPAEDPTPSQGTQGRPPAPSQDMDSGDIPPIPEDVRGTELEDLWEFMGPEARKKFMEMSPAARKAYLEAGGG